MKRLALVAACAVSLLVGCASISTPETLLKRGYDSASVVVTTTTLLLDRGAISSAEARRVLVIGRSAKEGLDEGKEALRACRAAAGDCTSAVTTIKASSVILMELESSLGGR